MKKLFVCGNIDAEEIATTDWVIRIEERADLFGLNRSDLCDGESSEVDVDPSRRESNVASYGARVGAGGSPGAALLSGSRGPARECECKDCEKTGVKLHEFRMTSAAANRKMHQRQKLD